MKITIESTTRIVLVNGVPSRVWQGTTASGVEIGALVTRIGVAILDQAGNVPEEFERELVEHAAPLPAAVAMFPYASVVIVVDEEPAGGGSN